ncbi:MAG: ArsA-related P-loop ATPase [Deltaproteobacteria bacterium]|nr:ArsA-related P-loop ATPase [Deltaproteobacteria bacterium]
MIEHIDRDKRIVLITGKGGVGKTTVAASIVRALAAGRRVLGCEIGDPEGGPTALGRLFGKSVLTPTPEPVAENLSLCHLWAPLGHELFLRSILPSKRLIRATLRSKALRRFLIAAPSFHEMGIYYHLLTLLEARRPDGKPVHDTIVIDMPATGHALALTGLVDMLLRIIPKGPVNKALRRGEEIIRDPWLSTTLVVALPERLPVSESIELVHGLRATRTPVGGVVLNRMPEDPLTPEERAAITPILQNGLARPMLGTRRLLQIEESQAATSRLAEETNLPSTELPELKGTASEILEGLTTLWLARGVIA